MGVAQVMPYGEQLEDWPPRRWRAFLNAMLAVLAVVGLSPRDTVAVEVPERRTGRLRRTPLVFAEYKGSRYLVSLLGEAEWVRNVRANHYCATIRRGWTKAVRLEEVAVAQRPPILKAYVGKRVFSKFAEREPREFFGIAPNATLEDLFKIAHHYPVFRIIEIETVRIVVPRPIEGTAHPN